MAKKTVTTPAPTVPQEAPLFGLSLGAHNTAQSWADAKNTALPPPLVQPDASAPYIMADMGNQPGSENDYEQKDAEMNQKTAADKAKSDALDKQIADVKSKIIATQKKIDDIDNAPLTSDEQDSLNEQKLRAGAQAYMAFDPATAMEWNNKADTLKATKLYRQSELQRQLSDQARQMLPSVAADMNTAVTPEQWNAKKEHWIGVRPELATYLTGDFSQESKDALLVAARQGQYIDYTQGGSVYSQPAAMNAAGKLGGAVAAMKATGVAVPTAVGSALANTANIASGKVPLTGEYKTILQNALTNGDLLIDKTSGTFIANPGHETALVGNLPDAMAEANKAILAGKMNALDLQAKKAEVTKKQKDLTEMDIANLKKAKDAAKVPIDFRVEPEEVRNLLLKGAKFLVAADPDGSTTNRIDAKDLLTRNVSGGAVKKFNANTGSILDQAIEHATGLTVASDYGWETQTRPALVNIYNIVKGIVNDAAEAAKSEGYSTLGTSEIDTPENRTAIDTYISSLLPTNAPEVPPYKGGKAGGGAGTPTGKQPPADVLEKAKTMGYDPDADGPMKPNPKGEWAFSEDGWKTKKKVTP